MEFYGIFSACVILTLMTSSTLAWRITDFDGNTIQEGGKAESGTCFDQIKGKVFEIDDCRQGNFFRGKSCSGYFTAVFNKQPYYRIPSDAVSFRVYC